MDFFVLSAPPDTAAAAEPATAPSACCPPELSEILCMSFCMTDKIC